MKSHLLTSTSSQSQASHLSRKVLRSLIVPLAFLVSSPSVWSDTRTWTGGAGNDNWGNGNNWGGTALNSGDALVFSGTTRLTPINNFTGGTPFAGITFDATAGAFQLSGNGIYLTGNIVNSGTSVQTFGHFTGGGITIADGDRTIQAAAGDIVVNSRITTSSGSGTNTLIAQVGSTRVLTLNGDIVGDGGLTKADVGTAVLSGTNTYTGITTLDRGTLQISSASNLQGTSGLTFTNAGTDTALQVTASLDLAKNIVQQGNGNYLVDAGNTLTLSGVISNTGVFNKQGEGTVVLTGTNTFSGATLLTSGTLGIVSADNLQGTSGLTFVAGPQSTALYAMADGIVLNKNILQDGPGNYQVDTGNTLTLSGTVSGFGQFRKNGEGTIVLEAANSYSGKTVVNAGTLRLGSNGSITNTNMDVFGGTYDMNGKDQTLNGTLTLGTGSTAGSIMTSSSASTLTVNTGIETRSGSIAVDLTGSAELIKSTTGTVTLTGSNSYEGGTTINTGVLQLGDGGTSGSINGNVSIAGSEATLTFNRSNTDTFSGTLSGTGRVQKAGSGTITLTALNSYEGGTTIDAGFLVAGNAQALGSGAVVINGTGTTSSTMGILVLEDGTMIANDITLSGGAVEREIENGGTYNLGTTGEVRSSFDSDAYEDTITSILASGTTDGVVLTYSMSNSLSESILNDDVRISDIFQLDLQGDESADYYVLQLSLADSPTEGFVGYLDGSIWVNAGTNFVGNLAYNGSTTVGDYGYNSSGAWVVLNHNTDFALITVPEPSIAVLGGIALLLFGFRRRR